MGTYMDKDGNIRHTRSGTIIKRWVEDNKFTGTGHHVNVEEQEEKEVLKQRFKKGDLVHSSGFYFSSYYPSGNFKGAISDKRRCCIYKVIKKQFKKKERYFIMIQDWENNGRELMVAANNFTKILQKEKKKYLAKIIKKYQEEIDYLNIYLNYLKHLEVG